MGDKNTMIHDLEDKKVALDDEEELILRELQELDTMPAPAVLSTPPPAPRTPSSGRGRGGKVLSALGNLNMILAECEKEVRDAKGYVADAGPPLVIVRCKEEEPIPKHATFLSRPKDTGVDFTIPVKVAGYTALIKTPITLNQIRDKTRHNKYRSAEEYLGDMRLLHQNSATFNATEDVEWIVQHARLLLETAEIAVEKRALQLMAAEEAVAADEVKGVVETPAKRKRESTSNGRGVGKSPQINDHSRRGKRRPDTPHPRHRTDTPMDGWGSEDINRDGKALEAIRNQLLGRMDEISSLLLRELHSSVREMKGLRDSVQSLTGSLMDTQGSLLAKVASLEQKLLSGQQELDGKVYVAGAKEEENPEGASHPSARVAKEEVSAKLPAEGEAMEDDEEMVEFKESKPTLTVEKQPTEMAVDPSPKTEEPPAKKPRQEAGPDGRGEGRGEEPSNERVEKLEGDPQDGGTDDTTGT
ncbi:hypothetical protein NDN08_000432 [Rhodosorus marinus]|uniref:Bromo domain-containing protein n=1 Tax=Rhodosorus marinus TaxID=101924 RepID=A0AAV8UQY7_9RHOD|nr:hypothetical protein NDN08_000432 [Rhodosorus marinus]